MAVAGTKLKKKRRKKNQQKLAKNGRYLTAQEVINFPSKEKLAVFRDEHIFNISIFTGDKYSQILLISLIKFFSLSNVPTLTELWYCPKNCKNN